MGRALPLRPPRVKADTVKWSLVVIAVAREARVQKIKGQKAVVGKAFPALGGVAKGLSVGGAWC